MGPIASCRARGAATLAASALIFQTARYFEAEPLLACVTMGLLVGNYGYGGSSGSSSASGSGRLGLRERPPAEREDLLTVIGGVMSITNVAFFAVLGASVKLVSERQRAHGLYASHRLSTVPVALGDQQSLLQRFLNVQPFALRRRVR